MCLSQSPADVERDSVVILHAPLLFYWGMLSEAFKGSNLDSGFQSVMCCAVDLWTTEEYKNSGWYEWEILPQMQNVTLYESSDGRAKTKNDVIVLD